ncbi:MAG TPA: hypothetical protein PLY88_07630 [Candidatus Omnitrophota bacterium]|nr:hypothetical protein [Candidatus Omnitrophota bacterium]
MKKAVLWLCLILSFSGCGPVSTKVPLREDHPAYGFYQTANSFYVASSSCTKLAGHFDIRHEHVGTGKDFEKKQELAPGLFILRDKRTGAEWVSVYFLEYTMASGIPRICSWSAEQFPVGELKTE